MALGCPLAAVVGLVLWIPCWGHFMCPFVVAGLALRYLRINVSVMFGHPLRNPFCTTLRRVDILGLHNDWCANLTALERVCTECVNDATVMAGWL